MLLWLYTHVSSVCVFKCFRCFRLMLQLFYMDIAYVAMVIHASLLHKVYPHRFQTTLHQWFWPLLVKVVGDSLPHHRRLRIGGGMGHHHRIRLRSGGVVGYFTATSEYDPAAFGRIPPSVLRTIRRDDGDNSRFGVPSGGDDGDNNISSAYHPVAMTRHQRRSRL